MLFLLRLACQLAMLVFLPLASLAIGALGRNFEPTVPEVEGNGDRSRRRMEASEWWKLAA